MFQSRPSHSHISFHGAQFLWCTCAPTPASSLAWNSSHLSRSPSLPCCLPSRLQLPRHSLLLCRVLLWPLPHSQAVFSNNLRKERVTVVHGFRGFSQWPIALLFWGACGRFCVTPMFLLPPTLKFSSLDWNFLKIECEKGSEITWCPKGTWNTPSYRDAD